MSDLICPYCNQECEADSELNEPDHTYEHECENCDKTFVYRLDYETHYYEEQAPCLNGSEHEWAPVTGWPATAYIGKERCKICDKRREANP